MVADVLNLVREKKKKSGANCKGNIFSLHTVVSRVSN